MRIAVALLAVAAVFLAVSADEQSEGELVIVREEAVVEHVPVSFANEDTTIFEPEDDWKEVLPHEHLPGGLDIRMDLAQGKKWARKLKQPERTPPREALPGEEAHPEAAKVEAEPVAPKRAGAEGAVPEEDKHVITQRVLMGLPEPEPELVKALRSKMPEAELKALLEKLWQKRQKELEQAMAAMTTDADTMRELIARIVVDDEEGKNLAVVEDKVVALEDLEYHVTDVDNAVDFAYMGGLEVAARLLDHSDTRVQLNAAWVIGSAVKYNRKVQHRAVAGGVALSFVQLLRNALEHPSESGVVKVANKALYALGSLTRASRPGQEQLLELHGVDTLRQLMAMVDTADLPTATQWRRLRAKAAALVADLVVELRDAQNDVDEAAAAEAAGGPQIVMLAKGEEGVDNQGRQWDDVDRQPPSSQLHEQLTCPATCRTIVQAAHYCQTKHETDLFVKTLHDTVDSCKESLREDPEARELVETFCRQAIDTCSVEDVDDQSVLSAIQRVLAAFGVSPPNLA